MKKLKNIHNLDTLEREIYRLELEAKNIEQKFDRNFERLQNTGFSMFINSIFHRRKSCTEGIFMKVLKKIWSIFSSRV